MRKDNNSQKNESNKDLNDLLPLTLISDLEIENQSDSSFEDINSEIVDVRSIFLTSFIHLRI